MSRLSLDQIDIALLRHMQQDGSLSQRDLAERVGLSQNACWRRLQALRASGIVAGEVVRLDRQRLGLKIMAIVMIRTHHHSADWLKAFREHVSRRPEVVDFMRISGDFDYMLKVVTRDMTTYDEFYQDLIAHIELQTVTTYFVMEAIADQRPLDLARVER